MRFLGVVLGVGVLVLAGCASGPKDDGMSRAVSRTAQGLPGAVATPFSDLNMTRTEIPPRLALLRSAYEALPVANCRTLAVEVIELTNILGPDIDEARPEETMDQRMGGGAADLILGAVTSTMSDFIPFRSAVREATGASAHERRLRAAYERGISRRAYLKGVGAAKGCAPPAAPQPAAGIAPIAPPAQPSSGRSGRPG